MHQLVGGVLMTFAVFGEQGGRGSRGVRERFKSGEEGVSGNILVLRQAT